MGAIWNVTALRYDVPALFDDGTKTKDFLPDILWLLHNKTIQVQNFPKMIGYFYGFITWLASIPLWKKKTFFANRYLIL